MSWIGLGQGSQMSGANIFVIYADADGKNVTLSPRLGTGHTEPDADTAAKVTLLDGSGIIDGKMIANVKCSNCQSWSGGTMDFTSASSDWIYAYKAGDALNTNSLDASITQHDEFDSFTFDLVAASGGDGSLNPFTNTISSSTGNTTTTASNNTSSGSESSSSSGSQSGGISEKTISDATLAHGAMGAAAFVLIFPTGSIVIRVLHFPGVLWVHVVMQILGYLIALALMETGVWIAVHNGQMMLMHPLIGLVVVCGLFFQPFMGLGHHLLFKRRVKAGLKGGPNALTYPHVWWGRALVTLGIVNGGLGLQLSGREAPIEIAYGTVAGIIWAVWMGLAVLTWMRSRNADYGMGEKERPIIRRVSNDSEDVRNFSRLRYEGPGPGR
jgi:hypothetical protein